MRIISNQSRKSKQGFTLIEMIGVLAVIAILASMLIPKIFEAINSARINNTVQSYNSIKTAVMDHYGKYGAINVVGPAPVASASTAQMTNYDKSILLPEALIDKAFVARVGTNWQIRAVAGVASFTVWLQRTRSKSVSALTVCHCLKLLTPKPPISGAGSYTRRAPPPTCIYTSVTGKPTGTVRNSNCG